MLRPFSGYVSTMLKVYLDCARGMFRPCSRHYSTVLESQFDQVLFHRAHGMFRPYWRYVSNALELCFDYAQSLLGPCSRYVSTVLQLYFDRSGRLF